MRGAPVFSGFAWSASRSLSARGTQSNLAFAIVARHYLRAPAQHHDAMGILRAGCLVGRLRDEDARTTGNDLLDAPAGLVEFDAEMKLLDPRRGHGGSIDSH